METQRGGFAGLQGDAGARGPDGASAIAPALAVEGVSLDDAELSLAELRHLNGELTREVGRQVELRRAAERRVNHVFEELKVMEEELQRAHDELRRVYEVATGR